MGWEREDVRVIQRRQQLQPVALMRTSGVVVFRVPIQDNPQVAFAGDEHPVCTFGADGLHPAFSESVHPRALRCGLLDLDVLGGEDNVEGVGENRVPVPDQVAEPVGPLPDVRQKFLASWVAQTAVGCSVTPRMCTRLVPSSRTKDTYNRLSMTVSI